MMISTVYILFSLFVIIASFDRTSVFVQAKQGLRGRFPHRAKAGTQTNTLEEAHPTTNFQQEAHVLLMGLPGGSHLTPGQTHFFDESLRSAYNSFNTSPDLQVVQVQMVDQQESLQDGNRELYGWDPRYRRFYDYSVFMTARCGRMCSSHRRQLPTTSVETDNTISQQQHQRRQQEPAPVLPDVVDHAKFERTFLRMLQRGPHPIFHQVTDCHIAWN